MAPSGMESNTEISISRLMTSPSAFVRTAAAGTSKPARFMLPAITRMCPEPLHGIDRRWYKGKHQVHNEKYRTGSVQHRVESNCYLTCLLRHQTLPSKHTPEDALSKPCARQSNRHCGRSAGEGQAMHEAYESTPVAPDCTMAVPSAFTRTVVPAAAAAASSSSLLFLGMVLQYTLD